MTKPLVYLIRNQSSKPSNIDLNCLSNHGGISVIDNFINGALCLFPLGEIFIKFHF